VLEEPVAVLRARVVVVHVLREQVQRVAPPLSQIGAVGVANDLHHTRSRSATAYAASPSPRPVNPRPSVVVARTLTSPPSTAPESRPRISSRRVAIFGSSPTRTQSALTRLQPAARTRL